MAVNGYSANQIRLHWIIAALILVQYLFSDGISAAWRVIARGQPIDPTWMAQSHVIIGILIFILALWRVALRLTRGAPKAPEEESPLLQKLAGLVHFALYCAILLIPVSGGLAWFGGVKVLAEIHEAGTGLLQFIVALHVVGALYHRFVLKTEVMTRMVRAER